MDERPIGQMHITVDELRAENARLREALGALVAAVDGLVILHNKNDIGEVVGVMGIDEFETALNEAQALLAFEGGSEETEEEANHEG
jgi:hypothetical protein